MSSLTKTPAQESASADAATSVPVPAGTTTSVHAQAGTFTTEARPSVGEYHALQYNKLLNTDGSTATDYGSDISDVPSEDGEILSSAADS
ncbi:hypothetical protein PC116_g22948 [Phytophthora cactorum]|uniref:Uncharacterized protein n=1 Tax=Phytophthora cactorum TaxID=29920 RepID=A0A8T1BRM6_9STRA|nr:hypothetical protein PC111_g18129 [Phytophthora cactorum]KAG2814207.1 hypothetical protein PC112_g14411 [Phytophthora cactorum]KAG2842544.1 hypothetical protein PC113_g18786 [Phytophthora cactorum]KAG2894184.1 hypothetical protein PC114_g15998 [Phytophthora cactorum]KAG2894208.1 hypothetical protein PC115_g18219 [Phytophthora cactorum]